MAQNNNERGRGSETSRADTKPQKYRFGSCSSGPRPVWTNIWGGNFRWMNTAGPIGKTSAPALLIPVQTADIGEEGFICFIVSSGLRRWWWKYSSECSRAVSFEWMPLQHSLKGISTWMSVSNTRLISGLVSGSPFSSAQLYVKIIDSDKFKFPITWFLGGLNWNFV